MKKRNILLLSTLFFLITCAHGQSTAVKIAISCPANSGPLFELLDSPTDLISIRVLKACTSRTLFYSLVSFSRTDGGNGFIYHFSIPQNHSYRLDTVADGLEISFLEKSNDVQLPIGPSASVTPVPVPLAGGTLTPMTVSSGSSQAPTPAGSPIVNGNSKVNEASVDLSVPESPAFTILGLTPQSVVRPASPREFAMALLNGVDENGNFQSGVALDTAPFLLFLGKSVTINNYRTSYFTQLLARSQFSFAVVKGASEDDKSTKVATGLNLTLWDRGDPRLDRELDTCFDSEIGKLRSTFKPISPVAPQAEKDVEIERRTELLQQAAEGCRKEAQKRNWGRSAWGVGAAGSWISKTGESRSLRWNGGAFWTSVAYGFEEVEALRQKAQLIFHLRYRTNEQVEDSSSPGGDLRRNTTLLGGRLRFGSPNFAGNIETIYNREKRSGVRSDSNFRFSVGAERKIAKNLYFSLSFGGETTKKDNSENKVFVLSSFKWGYSKEPTVIQP